MGSHTVTVYTDFAALPSRHEELLRQASAGNLFQTLPWFLNFVQSGIVSKDKVRILAVDAGDDSPSSRAALAMCFDESNFGLLRRRTLTSLTNYYSALFGPAIDPNAPDLQLTLDAIAKSIASDKFRWDVVNLLPLAVDETIFPALVAGFSRSGLLVQTYFCFGNWYLDVNGQSFIDYLKTRPSRLSKTAKRQRRILEAGTRFRFKLFSDTSDLDRGIEDYNTVYNSSWKVPEPYPKFMDGLIRTCAQQGWLRLGIAYMDDTPAAAQVWMVVNDTASIYKMAYDQRFAKESVGTVLSGLLMEHVIDVDKVQIVDYLSGDDAYKRDWMSHRRERWGIVAFNLRSPYGLLAAARHLGGRATRYVLGLCRHLKRAKN